MFIRKSYITILCLIFASGLLCSSCDDFLSERPEGEFQLTTIEQFDELLFGETYPTLRADGQIDYLATWFSDDFESMYPGTPNLMTEKSSHNTDVLEVNKLIFTWQPRFVDDLFDAQKNIAMGTWSNIVPWGMCYRKINRTNTIIKYSPDSEGSEERKDNVLGEAYALRAFYYFTLVNYYALPYLDKEGDPSKNPGVPIILSPDISADQLPRSSVKAVYDLMVADIEASCQLLEKKKVMKSKFRLNHISVHLLASRIFLHMGEYEKALAHARYVAERQDLIDFSVVAPQTKTVSEDSVLFNPASSEILFSYGKNTWWVPVSPFAASNSFQVSQELYGLYDTDDIKDFRKEYFFYANPVVPLGTKDTVGYVYEVRKFKKKTADYTLGLRTTEAYMNGMEAAFHLYKEKSDNQALTQGLAWFNEFMQKRVRNKNGMPLENIAERNPDKLIEMCRVERRKEFCFESQRWFDLKRYGMPQIERRWIETLQKTEVYVLKERDLMYVLDIPRKVTELNNRLEQNPSTYMPYRSAVSQ